jgi:hypothetical protein
VVDKPPSFDPPSLATPIAERDASGGTGLDGIVRAFHGSAACADAHARLVGRRASLARAWDAFAHANPGGWSAADLARARNLDYVMRTALYEGNLDRGCSAYGACERNVIALSIRNRGREGCTASVSCSFQGDFEGVASSVSQYNVWDELLTQVILPKQNGWRASYRKLRRRGSFDFPVLSVGAAVWREGTTVTAARLVLGGVASAPVRLGASESALVGRPLDATSIADAAAAAAGPSRPMDNTDFSFLWRKEMTSKFVALALKDLGD